MGRATYQDLLDAPKDKVAEILGGVLHLNPRPGAPHVAAASALGEELGPPFKRGRGGPGGWLILDGPEVHLTEDVVVPDLAGWRRQRLPHVADEAFIAVAPDWVCEIVSPSTQKVDRMMKLPAYAREGVSHVWLVDPRARTVECLRLEGERYVILGAWGDEQRVRLEPFDAIELDLAILWADVRLEE